MLVGGGIGRGGDSPIFSTRGYMQKTRGINLIISRIKAGILGISIMNTGEGNFNRLN
jgi:hypothetical protein